ncbi:XRE family transcriptional regulator [Serratia symbiotica]|uniref:Helix-turn-helix transcriptional regulator n=1 Tax=Serratia symbiotica TaxID=138074 RepID=A0A068Z3H7_9GAMM|nr:helix-turn-helix transcriptional regulator [Serratia symbiotica]QLH62281.1 helix-turn-helix transcriptional regulator [Serratia symbiotica]CDS55683.1 Peptidase S24 [Serratia symbiotica]
MKVGEKIRQIRKAKKMTILELATAAGSDVGNISRLERGKQGYSDLILRKIADALAIPISELFSTEADSDAADLYSIKSLSGSGRNSLYRVDVLEVYASAGNGAYTGDVVEIIHSIEYVPEHAKMLFGNRPQGSVMLINVRGDSMMGTLEPGDLIFVDVRTNVFDGDGIYVFDFNGDTFVKRLQKVKYELKVLSDNKAYEAWSISPDEMEMLHIQGKVLVSQSQQTRRHG